MKNKKLYIIASLTLLLMVFGASSLEARHHKHMGVSFSAGQVVSQPTYIVQRRAPVQQVYIYPRCPHCSDVVIIQEPAYQQVYVQQPVIRPAFSFNWNFWR